MTVPDDRRSDFDLWRSEQPTYGTVRAVVVDEPFAVVLDDLNSDGREVALTLLLRTDDGWRVLATQVDVPLPGPGEPGGAGWGLDPSDEQGYGWSYGRADAGQTVPVELGPIHTTVTADADGWWLCVRPMSGEEFDPRRPTWPGDGTSAYSSRLEITWNPE